MPSKSITKWFRAFFDVLTEFFLGCQDSGFAKILSLKTCNLRVNPPGLTEVGGDRVGERRITKIEIVT